MKHYHEYMDSVKVPEELHRKLVELSVPAKKPAWKRYGAAAAALVLAVGLGGFGAARAAGLLDGNWKALVWSFQPDGSEHALSSGPMEFPTGEAEGAEKNLGGYEARYGAGPESAVAYYMLPWIDYGDASAAVQGDYSLVPPDGGMREAGMDDILAVLGLDREGLSAHLDWGGYDLGGTVGFNADGSTCMMTAYGESDGGYFSLELCAGALPPQCCINVDEERAVTEVMGVEVSGVKNSGIFGDDARGLWLDVTREVAFVAHDVGVRFKAYGTEDGKVEKFVSRFVRWAIVEGLDLSRAAPDGALPAEPPPGAGVGEPDWNDGAGGQP